MALELGGGWHQPDQLLLPPCNIEKFPALILMSNQTQQGRDVLDLIIQMKPSISTNYASDASSDKSDSDPEDQEEVCHRLYRRSMNHILSSTKLMGSSSNGKNKLRRPSTMSGHGGGGSGSGGLAHSFLSESMADLAAASVGLKSGGGHHQHGSSYLIGGGGGGGDLGDGSDSEMPKKRRRRGGKRDTRHDAKEAKNLPRDAAGNVIVPCLVGKPGAEQVTITSLGHIVHDREGFHSGRYIWPAGFTSLKSYVSLVNPGKRTVYTNKIIDTGADGPIFEVTAEDIPSDHPSGVFQGPSASGVWKKILVEMSAKGIVGPKTHVSGPEFYGLSDLGVIKAIQELPGAALCSKYTMQVWTSTEEGNNNNNNNNSNLNE